MNKKSSIAKNCGIDTVVIQGSTNLSLLVLVQNSKDFLQFSFIFILLHFSLNQIAEFRKFNKAGTCELVHK